MLGFVFRQALRPRAHDREYIKRLETSSTAEGLRVDSSGDRILPAAALDRDRIAAWTHAGPNPLDRRLLVLERLRPPVVASYSRVLALDDATGEIDDLAGQEHRSGYLSGSWSPDGRRLALTTDDGKLLLRARDGSFAPVSPAPAGWYPSWNPAGSSIYIGGGVVDSDGKGVEELLEQGPQHRDLVP